MYKITVTKNDTCTSYTIPRASIRLLALTKMNDIYGNILMAIETEEDAIDFLNKIGIKVEEI